jgi:hypothetical protein
VAGIGGGLPGERGVGRPAQQLGGEVGERRVAGPAGVEAGQDVAGVGAVGPGDPQAACRSLQAGEHRRVRRRDGAEDPHARLDHEARCRSTRQERDLRVPPLDGQLGSLHDRPGSVGGGHHLLLWEAELDRVARSGGGEQRVADGRELGDRRRGPAGVDLPLDALIGQLGAAAHQRPPHVDRRGRARGVDIDRPQRGGSRTIGQQRRRALAQHGRVQRDPPIRRVVGLRPRPGGGVDRAARLHPRRHVGDGVGHPPAVAERLDGQRLVEIARARRVDGHEVEVRRVLVVGERAGRHPVRLRQGLLREGPRHLQVPADAVEIEGQGLLGPDAVGGHSKVLAGGGR